MAVGDINGDQRPDIAVGNKKGSFVFLQEARQVSPEEWRQAQPRIQFEVPSNFHGKTESSE